MTIVTVPEFVSGILGGLVTAVVLAALQYVLDVKKHQRETRQAWLIEKRLEANQKLMTAYSEYMLGAAPYVGSTVAFMDTQRSNEETYQDNFKKAKDVQKKLAEVILSDELMLGRRVLMWYHALVAGYWCFQDHFSEDRRTALVVGNSWSQFVSRYKYDLAAASKADIQSAKVYGITETDFKDAKAAGRKLAKRLFVETEEEQKRREAEALSKSQSSP